MRWYHHLQVRVIIIVVIIVTLFIIAFTYYSLNQTNTILRGQLDNYGSSISNTLATFSVQDVLAWNYPALQASLDNVGGSDDKIVAIQMYSDNTNIANYFTDSTEYDLDEVDNLSEFGLEFISPIIIQTTKEKRNLGYVRVILSEKEYIRLLATETAKVIIYSIIFLVSITIFIYLFIEKLIIKPVKDIENSAKVISEGDLTLNVPVNSDDEIGLLAKAYNLMVTNLRELVLNIKKNVEYSFTVTQSFTMNSETVNVSSRQIEATMNMIAQGEQKLVSSFKDIETEIERLTEGITKVRDASQESAKFAIEVNDEAKHGSNSAKRAGEKIEAINKVFEISTKDIEGLGTQIEEVNQVVAVISSISDQTNLLALNAAIEAARAGDAGKGFAVVAEEVRALAEESHRSTKQIEKIISKFVNNTHKAVGSMKDGAKEVLDGSKVINEALSSLNTIGLNISKVTSEIEMINESAQKQLDSSIKLKESIDSVNIIVSKSAKGTQQVSDSIKSTTKSIQEIAQMAKDLSGESTTLKDLIDRFKI